MKEDNHFTWCLHCEHVFYSDIWLRNQEECPLCGANMFMDGWPWDYVAQLTGYPFLPENGCYYPLYPYFV